MDDNGKGFNDPNGVYPKYKDEVTPIGAVNLKSGTTETNPHLSLTLRRSTRITGVATATLILLRRPTDRQLRPVMVIHLTNQQYLYSAAYPYNKVLRNRKWPYKRIDDTTGNERIHERHRTGTSYEIDKDGNKVEIIKGQSFRLLSNKEQVQIQGDSDITIDGRHKIYINKTNTEVTTTIYK